MDRNHQIFTCSQATLEEIKKKTLATAPSSQINNQPNKLSNYCHLLSSLQHLLRISFYQRQANQFF